MSSIVDRITDVLMGHQSWIRPSYAKRIAAHVAAAVGLACPTCGYEVDPQRLWCPCCLKWVLPTERPAPDSGLEGL